MKRASIIIGTLFIFTGLVVSVYLNLAVLQDGTGNGSSAQWGRQEQRLVDEMCADAETDEEKVIIIYHWIIENIEYDYKYDMAYQHFDINRVLRTKKGVVSTTQTCLRCFAEVKISSVMLLMGIYVKTVLCSIHGIECFITVLGGISM